MRTKGAGVVRASRWRGRIASVVMGCSAGLALACIFHIGAALAQSSEQPQSPLLPLKVPPANSAPYDWSGLYFGGHAGYSMGPAMPAVSDPVAAVVDSDFRSLYGGIQAGYNHVLPSRLFLGAEADMTFPNYYEDGFIYSAATTRGTAVTDKIDYIGTLRGRVGYAFDDWLFYLTGGFAWAQARFGETPGVAESEDKLILMRIGWVAGLGAEYAIAPDWSVRLEYLYDDLGMVGGVFPSGTAYRSAFDIGTVRLGLDHKLGATDPDGSANASGEWPLSPDSWNIHSQVTVIGQGYPAFPSPYVGTNSLSGANQAKDTVSVDAFIGYRPWDGTDVYINPELFQGFGLSDTFGIAGFPNTEAQKSAFPMMRFNVARIYVQQTFGLGGEQENIPDGPDQIADKQDVSRLTFRVGKFTPMDYFDDNAYAHDGRTQFFNWQLYCCGSYDWTMDQLGYTWGAMADLNQKSWAFRAGYFLVPIYSSTDEMDMSFPHGEYISELELRYGLFGEPGKLRLMAWANHANMGSYSEALAEPLTTPGYPNITLVRTIRTNYGFAANLEQALDADLGVFARASWSPGQDEIIGWTECDESVSAGISLKGAAWGRPNDRVGVAGVLDGLSSQTQAYFAAGGLGILIGDGALDYRPEKILETYYSLALNTWASFTFDYQFVDNPAYNAARGPVNIFAGRLHAEF